MATRDRLIKAASRLMDIDGVDPPPKKVLKNLQSYGQATDDMDELYGKGVIARQEFEKLCDTWDKFEAVWNDQTKEYMKQITAMEKNTKDNKAFDSAAKDFRDGVADLTKQWAKSRAVFAMK